MQAEIQYHPTLRPIRRMRTAPHPLALGLGDMALVQNGRWADGILRARNPIAQQADGPPVASGEFRGALDGAFDGKRFSAWYNPSSGKTEIWSLTSGGTWADVTPDSGKHGDCRFGSSSVLNFYCFEVVRDPFTEQDCLVISDPQAGATARIYAKQTSGGSLVMSVHNPISPPFDAQRQKVLYTWAKNRVAGGSGTMPSYSNSDGSNFAAATSSGSAPDINVQLTRSASSAVANKTAELQYASTIDASDCFTINFLVDRGRFQQWLEHLKIEIRDSGGNYTTVYNLPSGIYGVLVTPVDGISTREVWTFALDHVPAADRDALDRIRFTWATTKLPPASSVLNIYAIGFSTGEVPGGAICAGSYYNSDSRAESPRILYDTYDAARPEDIGGRPLDGLRIPISPRLKYSLVPSYQNPSTAMLEAGVDTYRFYRLDPGAEDFLLSKSVTLGTYSSGWSFASGSSLSIETTTDLNSTEDLDERVPLPPSFHKTIPKGCTALRWASGRLFAGFTADGGTNFFGFSDRQSPFRWRDAQILGDEASPARANLGAETVYKIEASPGAGVGSDLIFAVTDKSVWQTLGRDTSNLRAPQRVCPYGSAAPRAIRIHQGELWFYDTENLQLRVLRGATWDTPSKGEVDNLWETDLTSARTTGLGILGDRLYLSYTSDGGSAWDSCLVYYLPARVWEADDGSFPSGVLPFQFVPGFFPNSMLAFSHLGDVWYWDDPTNAGLTELDLATDEIQLDLRWPMYTADTGGPEDGAFTDGNLEVLADQGTGIDLVSTRSYITGGSHTGTLTLSGASSGIIRRMDTLSASPTGTVRDVACQRRLSGGTRSGKRLFAVWMYSDRRHGRGSKPSS